MIGSYEIITARPRDCLRYLSTLRHLFCELDSITRKYPSILHRVHLVAAGCERLPSEAAVASRTVFSLVYQMLFTRAVVSLSALSSNKETSPS